MNMNIPPPPNQAQQQSAIKSTPINQLPPYQQSQQGSQQQQQSVFLNEQHRQIVSRAQDAVQNFTLPTSSQMQTDLQEDDATIREVLQQINGGGGGGGDQQNPQQQQQQPPMMMPQQPQQAPMPMPMPMPPQPTACYDALPYQQQQPPPDSFLTAALLSGDARAGWLVAALYVAVALLPIEAYLGRYVPLDRFPYAGLATRALILAIAFVSVRSWVQT
jgi:hypothetical protein